MLSIPVVIASHTPNSITHGYVFISGHTHHRDIVIIQLLLHLLQKPDAKNDNRNHRGASYCSGSDNSLVQAAIQRTGAGGVCDIAAGGERGIRHG